MMIYLASDHRGFALKERIKEWLTAWHFEYVDCGASHYDPTDDYTDFVALAAQRVSENPLGNIAIVLGASGQGEAMVANRRRGVRATVLYSFNEEIIALSRQHNAANVLSLGASFISEEDAKRAIQLWLSTEFSNEPRHVRRIAHIDPS